MTVPIRVGVLGAARITANALVKAAKSMPGDVEVRAIAARDRVRAEKQASKLGIKKVHHSYQDLLADEELDAVYIPLPNSLHCEWSIRAMEAGKHVLCEKPIADNAEEAVQMAEVSRRTRRVLSEAMHLRYHPVHERVAAMRTGGELGKLLHAEAHVCFIIGNAKDIRWQFALGGGALMDLGVYAVMNIRNMVGEEPTIESATAKIGTPNVDKWLEAKLRFPCGATGRVLTSMWGRPFVDGEHYLEGTSGKLVVNDRIGLFNKLDLYREGKRVSREPMPSSPTTYERQLSGFVRSIRTEEPVLTGPDHFLPNMRVVDAMYRAAGLPARGEASR